MGVGFVLFVFVLVVVLLILLVNTHACNYRLTFFCEFLVVDRQCPVLARQCRKKNCFGMVCFVFG